MPKETKGNYQIKVISICAIYYVKMYLFEKVLYANLFKVCTNIYPLDFFYIYIHLKNFPIYFFDKYSENVTFVV
jgi:hypothetical protein